jgi:hypothetical protein
MPGILSPVSGHICKERQAGMLIGRQAGVRKHPQIHLGLMRAGGVRGKVVPGLHPFVMHCLHPFVARRIHGQTWAPFKSLG